MIPIVRAPAVAHVAPRRSPLLALAVGLARLVLMGTACGGSRPAALARGATSTAVPDRVTNHRGMPTRLRGVGGRGRGSLSPGQVGASTPSAPACGYGKRPTLQHPVVCPR